MGISIGALVISTSCALRESLWGWIVSHTLTIPHTVSVAVLKQLLVRENRRMDQHEQTFVLLDADRERVEEAARLEGITMEEALEKRKGFRYLY